MTKRITKTYDHEFKSQAVKLAQEISGHKAAEEPGIAFFEVLVDLITDLCGQQTTCLCGL